MIELVFVIVVLGILASLAMGRMDRDLKQEAADTILSHIRLAHQLALRDNKHRSDNNKDWQTGYWQFKFSNCGSVQPIYAVGSAGLTGTLDKKHAAIDPTNGKYLFGSCTEANNGADVSEDVFAGQHFGVANMKLTGCIGISNTADRGKNFGFDYLGRVHIKLQQYNNPGVSYFDNMTTRDCNLTVTMSDNDKFVITIEPETGHAFIVGQEAL